MKDFVLLLAVTAACATFLAESAQATPVTVIPDITNRITAVTADPTRADTVFTNFSTWQSAGGANTQRTMQITSTATLIVALEAELGPLGSGESYQINSATLTVGNATDDYADLATAHPLLVTYNPATVTWNTFNNGGVAGVDYDGTASATSVAGTNSATWDLTSVVQGWIDGGTNKGLYFKSVGDTTGASTFTTITGTWTLDAEIVTVPVNDPPNRVRVFLLGGQSNAKGLADPSALPTSPLNLQLPQDDVDFYQTEAGGLTTLRPLAEFGPEITWGRRLADELGDGLTTRIAIIKYALGGTDLEVDWKGGGDGTTSGDGPQYVTFQNKVGAGLAALATAYPDAVIEIEGMLWVQGERDAKVGYENNYEANLTDFIADVRLTYGADLPFIISRLSIDQTDIPAGPLGIVRAAQDAVAAADPLAALVDTDGFGMKVDNLHFDALGQQQIGDASAIQLLNLYPFLSPLQFGLGSGGDFDVTVNDAFDGFVYTLRSSVTMQAGEWDLEEAKTATGNTVNFTVTPVGLRRFYRVERTLP